MTVAAVVVQCTGNKNYNIQINEQPIDLTYSFELSKLLRYTEWQLYYNMLRHYKF